MRQRICIKRLSQLTLTLTDTSEISLEPLTKLPSLHQP